ncbi:MAG: ParB/RepB/Spo0J family partition protein [Salinisphaera sp.]|jgi:ParB family chromosome partitioning protein|nr:ParB/RepB/Spo0J family partition protein [Salinisphaera sp.]
MPDDATVQRLPIEMIQRDRDQARAYFDDQALTELARSIAESGVIQPVVVRGDATSGYVLLAGERRWRAAQRAGLDRLPAIVRNDLDDRQAAVLGLIENLQRESLGIMETAHGLARLADQHCLTHDAIAHRIGKSRVYVTNYLRLRQLAEPVQALLENHKLSLGHAKILAGLPAARQIDLAHKAVRSRWSVRHLEHRARSHDSASREPSTVDASHIDLVALESGLAEHVGNTVHIDFDPAHRRGELRIAFHDLDEFEGLLARLGYVPE